MSQPLCKCLLVLIAVVFGDGAIAEDWPHWRGANRDGVVAEKSGWSEGVWSPTEKLVWKGKIGVGACAVIVANKQLIATGWADGKDTVYALDAQTGKLIWEQSYACPKYGRHSEGDKGLYSGPSASPSYDKQTGFVYTLSTDGDLHCWDTRNQGQRLWGINFYDEYDVKQRPLVGTRRLRDYGYTTSPLVLDNMLIAEVGDDEGNLMAFDKRTGKRLWTSESNDPAGHTGGLVPIMVDGISCVAVLTIRNLLVARLDKGHEGETLAEFPWETDFANSIATPAVKGNSIIVTSEYNQYSICRIDVTRKGAREVWRQPYASGVCTPVIHKSHVYWCWRGLYCLDFQTGKPIWRGGIYGDTASCIATKDDRLIVWANQGDLALVESFTRSPKKYTEVARVRNIFSRDVWPHIVLANGRLYCKDRDGHLKCFQFVSARALDDSREAISVESKVRRRLIRRLVL